MQPPPNQGQCARHPERVAETVCPRCGNFTCTECNPDGRSLCPSCITLGVAEPTFTPPPWERRSELGFVQGLWLTFKQSLFEPQKFWPSVPPEGPLLDALTYSWLLAIVTSLLTIPMTWLNFAQMRESMAEMTKAMESMRELARAFETVSEQPLIFAIGLAGLTIISYPLGLVFTAGLTYLGGLLFGASDKGFNATFRAIAYAQGPNIFNVVPVMGGMVAGLWTLILQVMALQAMQRTTVLRAIGALFWWLVLLCCCTGILGVVIAVSVAKGL